MNYYEIDGPVDDGNLPGMLNSLGHVGKVVVAGTDFEFIRWEDGFWRRELPLGPTEGFDTTVAVRQKDLGFIAAAVTDSTAEEEDRVVEIRIRDEFGFKHVLGRGESWAAVDRLLVSDSGYVAAQVSLRILDANGDEIGRESRVVLWRKGQAETIGENGGAPLNIGGLSERGELIDLTRGVYRQGQWHWPGAAPLAINRNGALWLEDGTPAPPGPAAPDLHLFNRSEERLQGFAPKFSVDMVTEPVLGRAAVATLKLAANSGGTVAEQVFRVDRWGTVKVEPDDGPPAPVGANGEPDLFVTGFNRRGHFVGWKSFDGSISIDDYDDDGNSTVVAVVPHDQGFLWRYRDFNLDEMASGLGDGELLAGFTPRFWQLNDSGHILVSGFEVVPFVDQATGEIDGSEVRLKWGLMMPDTDGDGNGLPDDWETLHDLVDRKHAGERDDDGDGLTNRDEYRLGTLPKEGDSDGDLIGDRDELMAGLDPRNDADAATTDLDGDGLSAQVEVLAGLNDHRTDSDGDGTGDMATWLAWLQLHGLDPSDPAVALGNDDGDGLLVAQEFDRNTDPNEADDPGPASPHATADDEREYIPDLTVTFQKASSNATIAWEDEEDEDANQNNGASGIPVSVPWDTSDGNLGTEEAFGGDNNGGDADFDNAFADFLDPAQDDHTFPKAPEPIPEKWWKDWNPAQSLLLSRHQTNWFDLSQVHTCDAHGWGPELKVLTAAEIADQVDENAAPGVYKHFWKGAHCKLTHDDQPIGAWPLMRPPPQGGTGDAEVHDYAFRFEAEEKVDYPRTFRRMFFLRRTNPDEAVNEPAFESKEYEFTIPAGETLSNVKRIMGENPGIGGKDELLPVEILQPLLNQSGEIVTDQHGKELLSSVDSIRFCRWRKAFSFPDSVFDNAFIESDPDRFHIRVLGIEHHHFTGQSDPLLSVSEISGMTDPAITSDDPNRVWGWAIGEEIESWQSDPMVLVCDPVDDLEFNGGASGDDVDYDRTHLASFGAKVRVQFPGLNDVLVEFPTMPPKGNVDSKLYLHNFGPGTSTPDVPIPSHDTSLALPGILTDFREAGETHSQIGIYLDWSGGYQSIHATEPSVRDYLEFINRRIDDDGFLSNQEINSLASIFELLVNQLISNGDLEEDVIPVFYINAIFEGEDPGTFRGGLTYMDTKIVLISLPGREQPHLAHEIGHAFGLPSTHYGTNTEVWHRLMNKRMIFDRNNQNHRDSKRISKDEETKIENSRFYKVR